MQNKSLATTGWITLCAFAFALGWILKPESETAVADSKRDGLQVVDPDQPAALDKRPLRARGLDRPFAELGDSIAWMERDRLGFGQALTKLQIAEIGESFRKELDPVKRRADFLRLIDGMTVENALLIREQIDHLPASSAEFRDFHYAWGKIGGVEAIMHGADTQKPDMIATFAGWTSADPAAARAWFDRLGPASKETYANQDYMKYGLLYGLANTDAELATNFALERGKLGDQKAAHMLTIVADKVLQTRGANGAAQWAKSLPPGEVRGAAMSRVADRFAQADPDAAARWALSLAGDEHGGRAIGAVCGALARRNPDSALEWARALGDSPHRSNAFHTAFESWAGRDPSSASQRLLEMPQSPDRDSAIGGLVSRHRWEDPLAAITWAGEIADAGRREHSMIHAGQAYLRRDPAAARQWLPNSGLSVEAQKKVTGGR